MMQYSHQQDYFAVIILLYPVVFFVCYLLQPCYFPLLGIRRNNKMSKLTIRRSAMPMGYAWRAFYDVAFMDNLSWLTFFLVITCTFYHYQDLPARMGVPIRSYA